MGSEDSFIFAKPAVNNLLVYPAAETPIDEVAALFHLLKHNKARVQEKLSQGGVIAWYTV